MNHDYTHCADYSNACPKSCFRGQLVEDLKHRLDLLCLTFSYAHLMGTDECPKWKRRDKNA